MSTRSPSESGRLRVRLSVNGHERDIAVESTDRLLDTLRGPLALTGTKEGCGEGECGACTVLLDGRAVNACLLFTWQAEGHRVTTIEGLSAAERDAIEQGFMEAGAVQCGFCTPGMVLSAAALLQTDSAPDEARVRAALSGNLCRCTGYHKIVEGTLLASRRLAGVREDQP